MRSTGVPFSAASAARTLAATVSVSRIARAPDVARLAPPEDGVVDPRVHVGQEQWSSTARAAVGQALAERLLDRRGRAADEREVAAAGDRAALHEGDRRLLQHGVGGGHPGRDVAELDDGNRGVFLHHVILKWSTSTQRRQRENDRGPVSPSPVGLAMVNELYPSPSRPRPACDRPFLTKMLQSHSFAMRLSRSMLRRVHHGGVAVAALGLDRQRDRAVGVRHAADRQDRHHLLGPEQRVVARRPRRCRGASRRARSCRACRE